MKRPPRRARTWNMKREPFRILLCIGIPVLIASSAMTHNPFLGLLEILVAASFLYLLTSTKP